MSEKQKATMREMQGSKGFARIAPIFDALPDRFTTTEVCRKARMTSYPELFVVISTLERSFHCHRNANGIWVKPGAGKPA